MYRVNLSSCSKLLTLLYIVSTLKNLTALQKIFGVLGLPFFSFSILYENEQPCKYIACLNAVHNVQSAVGLYQIFKPKNK